MPGPIPALNVEQRQTSTITHQDTSDLITIDRSKIEFKEDADGKKVLKVELDFSTIQKESGKSGFFIPAEFLRGDSALYRIQIDIVSALEKDDTLSVTQGDQKIDYSAINTAPCRATIDLQSMKPIQGEGLTVNLRPHCAWFQDMRNAAEKKRGEEEENKEKLGEKAGERAGDRSPPANDLEIGLEVEGDEEGKLNVELKEEEEKKEDHAPQAKKDGGYAADGLNGGPLEPLKEDIINSPGDRDNKGHQLLELIHNYFDERKNEEGHRNIAIEQGEIIIDNLHRPKNVEA